jgi:glycosyltransferase involved in cell wall biosynthesis
VKRFAILKNGPSGFDLVKAVIEWTSGGKLPCDHRAVEIKKGDPKNVVGCIYVDGKFVRREALAKQERKKRRSKSKITQIVWSYHDFGYGNSLAHVSRETVRWLHRAGVPIKIHHWNGRQVPDIGAPMVKPEELRSSAVIVMDRVPIPGHVFDQLSEAPFIGGYYMLEGTRAREGEAERLDGYDAIFTPSKFCRKALVESGVTSPVYVWGHGIDPEVFPYVPPKAGRPFTFLWFGDENRRKGYDLFLEAFSRLDSQNVRAWVRGPGSGNIASVRARYQNDRRIVWDTRVTPPEQLREMMAEADVLVAPLRAEGFGLCLLEAMASGRPVIATRWSGPLDFGWGDDFTYWVDVQGYEPSQNDAGLQVVPDMLALVSAMRHCAEHPEEVIERGIRVSRYVHENWRWDQKVMEVLPALRKEVPGCML